MNNRINVVTGLSYARISKITSFEAAPGDDSVNLVVAEWIPIPFVIGSLACEVIEGTDKNGKLFESTLSGKLTQKLSIPFCIVRVELEGDNTIIIGDPDHPVNVSTGSALLGKTINLKHQSWRPPYTLNS